MKITKYGHSCVLLDNGQQRILFDPGYLFILPELNLDAVLITHNHRDHCDPGVLQQLLRQNENLVVYGNKDVTTLLADAGVSIQSITEGQTISVGKMSLEVLGKEHAVIHPDIPLPENNSFLVNGKIFHPGDSYFVPDAPVETLLLPTGSPWSNIEQYLNFIDAVRPKQSMLIHDGYIVDGAPWYFFAETWFKKFEITRLGDVIGQEYEI